jgi:hypothetical protein
MPAGAAINRIKRKKEPIKSDQQQTKNDDGRKKEEQQQHQQGIKNYGMNYKTNKEKEISKER